MEWLRISDLLLVHSNLGHSSTVQTEKYTKFDQSELIKDFPIEESRLDSEGHSSYRIQLWEGLIDENASVVQW